MCIKECVISFVCQALPCPFLDKGCAVLGRLAQNCDVDTYTPVIMSVFKQPFLLLRNRGVNY